VAGIFYFIFSMLRETRSGVALRGMIIILLSSVVVYFLARILQLNALLLLLESFWVVAVLLFIIVFQQDFRRSLTRVGQMRLFRHLFTRGGRFLDETVAALEAMSKRRVGAIVAFERRNSLRVFSDNGTAIDARISAELLRTIFTSYTPLHDGAVIVRDERVVAAGCILPLSADETLGKDLGTRHRAALGLSEETDAIVVVVSEETGIISMAAEGQLKRGLKIDELRGALVKALDIELKEDRNG
jgi:diadenylate cyclase